MTAPPDGGPGRRRHYAGVLVTAEPRRFDEALAALAALPHVSLHQRDRATGRFVAVLESADRAAGERLLVALGRIPDVRSADLVYHLVDSGSERTLVLEEPAP